LLPEQVEELNQIYTRVADLYAEILDSIRDNKYTEIDSVISKQLELIAMIEQVNKKQIKRIKNHLAGTKNSLMYLGILGEIKNILLYTINLLKSQRDFIIEQDNKSSEK
jgi:Na+/phosphate symporter